MPKKTKLAPNLFEAIVEFKYGKGKDAPIVKIKATVDFENFWVHTWQKEHEALHDEAIERAFDVEIFNKVLNMKDLKAAYKAWVKRAESVT